MELWVVEIENGSSDCYSNHYLFDSVWDNKEDAEAYIKTRFPTDTFEYTISKVYLNTGS
jgi:hypothetical protein